MATTLVLCLGVMLGADDGQKTLELDADHLAVSIEKVILPALSLAPPDDRTLVGSIEGKICVGLIGSKRKRCQFLCELLTLARVNEARVALGLNGVPQTLDDSLATARGACSHLSLDADKLKKWNWKGDEPLVLTGVTGDRRTYLEIRRSFDEQRPWREIISITVPTTPR